MGRASVPKRMLATSKTQGPKVGRCASPSYVGDDVMSTEPIDVGRDVGPERRRSMRTMRVAILAGLLAAISLGATAGGVAAYGHADRPLAQIEVSLNCDNRDLCDPPGGVWVWIEIDADGTGDVAGAQCAHIQGLGAGASSIRGAITWSYSTGTDGAGFVAGIDPTNTYYLVTSGGQPPVALPVTRGHYAFHPAPGIAVETQVAP